MRKPVSAFREGQIAAWTQVKSVKQVGAWTPQVRAHLLRDSSALWKQLQRENPHDELTHFYAGRVAALKSASSRSVPARLLVQDRRRDLETFLCGYVIACAVHAALFPVTIALLFLFFHLICIALLLRVFVFLLEHFGKE